MLDVRFSDPRPLNVLRVIPLLIVAIVVSAYWWRVLRMAVKMRRKTGRAANFVPTEPLGRLLRWLWQPVVWIWIAMPWWVIFRARGPWLIRPLIASTPLLWLAAAVAVASYVATRVCWKKMGRSWRMGIDPSEKTDLVCTGPFAYVRHPIYALSSVLMLATAAAAPTPLMLFTAVIHLLLLQWEARREERHLLALHGEPYRQYLQSVGRFVPRSLHPAPVAVAGT